VTRYTEAELTREARAAAMQAARERPFGGRVKNVRWELRLPGPQDGAGHAVLGVTYDTAQADRLMTSVAI
jgi:hypothetical protein